MSGPGRKQGPRAEKPTDTADPVVLAAANQAATELVVMDSQALAKTRELAVRLGYDGPLEPELLEHGITQQMRRTVDACMETGRMLLLLKERVHHGEFQACVDRLGLGYKTAAKFMQAALKFANVSTSRHLDVAIGSQGKLLELLVLDDEEIHELFESGSTLGIGMDDVSSMTVRELRDALREAKADKDAKDRLLDKKNREIDQLKSDLEFKLSGDTEAQLDELASTTAMAEVALIRLTQAVGEINGAGGAPLRKKAQQAVQYLVAHLAELIDTYGIDVSLAEGLDTRPDWLAALPEDHAAPAPAPAAETPRKTTRPTR